MKKIFLAIMAVAAIAFCGCNKKTAENAPEEPGKQTFTPVTTTIDFTPSYLTTHLLYILGDKYHFTDKDNEGFNVEIEDDHLAYKYYNDGANIILVINGGNSIVRIESKADYKIQKIAFIYDEDPDEIFWSGFQNHVSDKNGTISLNTYTMETLNDKGEKINEDMLTCTPMVSGPGARESYTLQENEYGIRLYCDNSYASPWLSKIEVEYIQLR